MTGPALVWAQSTAGVIGRDGGIPWRLPEDLTRFKRLTLGHTVIMGRLTWDSLPATVRPLPGRRNMVLTRDPQFAAEFALADARPEAFRIRRVYDLLGEARFYRMKPPFG